jgi:hypothetical protein
MDVQPGKIWGCGQVLTLQQEKQRIFLKEQLIVILSRLKRLVGTSANTLHARFVHWTTPLTSSLPLGTLADLGRSKSELIAENALLRVPLIILKRQVKRPACPKTDRILLVLLARAVRAWKQTLFLVQPETDLAVASWSSSSVLEAQVKDSFSQAEGSRGNHRIDQGDGDEESALGSRAYLWGTPETGYACMQANHPEVHEARSHTSARRAEVGNLFA